MADNAASSPSPSSSAVSSPRISPIARLRLARHVHEQLQERKWAQRGGSGAPSETSEVARKVPPVGVMPSTLSFHDNALNNNVHTRQHVQQQPPKTVDALAKDLQRMWRKRQGQGGGVPGDVLQKTIEKIGAHEKDALVIHLLQQTGFLEAQRNDVVTVGEKFTTQLVQQQHELRVHFKAQITRLQEQLQQALHHHPEVARLEETIAQLQEANRQCEQRLLFAVQKLHRSRQRERELRLEHENDPLLWDL